MNFTKLNKQLSESFDALSKENNLFIVPINRDEIFEKYLAGFEDEETRQHHSCNCCRSFLRQYANVVAIINNEIVSVWDGIENEEFEPVLKNLREYIHSFEASDLFFVSEKVCGTPESYDKKRDMNWNHFFIKVPNQFVKNGDSIDSLRGSARSSKDVFKRALEELTPDSIQTVLELIAQGSLYRGDEHKNNLLKFQELQKKYKKLGKSQKNNFAWVNSVGVNPAVTHIRNTSIGTLLVDLSGDMDLDQAVSRYESVVAPTNYRRPKALVTPKMVEAAKKTIQELGLEDALDRRYAEQRDLNVEDIIYFYKPSPVKDVFDEVSSDTVVNPRKLNKTESISIEDFIEKVIPTAKNIEVLLENSHLNNMVSLLTSDCRDKLFKWDNPFSWYYTGGITDSIKERVKAAGGCVDGKLRASLSWSNYDDLDLHCVTPQQKEIYYGNEQDGYAFLDVDENAGSGRTRDAVENIIWKDSVPNGNYEVFVHNYSKRETKDVGFVVQIEFNGEVFEFAHQNNDVSRHSIKFKVENDSIIFTDGTESKPMVKEKWGLKTNTFHKVKTLTLSPNFWGGQQIGNKHYMFILDGATNDESPRSIFNEFLRNDLDKHKKVFEIVGGKLTIPDSYDQLSGLGFSSTKRNHVFVRVTGKFTRNLKVTF